MSENILSNIRVVEVGEGWVGPVAGMVLADLGAEVVKVESLARPDMGRGMARIAHAFGTFSPDYPDGKLGERPWNRNFHYTIANMGKIGVTLDLNHPKALAIFKRLIKISDVYLSNTALGVAEKLGINYEELVKVNPEIVYLSATGYGRTGPYRNRVAMANAIDAAAGLFGLRDYGDGDCTAVSPNAHCDSLAALTNTYAILVALYRRKETGKGVFIDACMVEAAMSHIGEALMDYTMNKRVWHSLGNRDAVMSPQGCYRCLGNDNWVTLSVTSDEEWQRLAKLMGNKQLAADERFATGLGRLQAYDELDRLVEVWTIQRTKFEAMESLQRVGIAAGAVLDSADVYNDKSAKERSFLQKIEEPDAGTRTLTGRMWRLAETKVSSRAHAPTLGEHNDYVLRDLIGLSSDEIAALEREGIIGTVPTEAGSK